MSPDLKVSALPPASFPRVSGDEPRLEGVRVAAREFSPRERG